MVFCLKTSNSILENKLLLDQLIEDLKAKQIKTDKSLETKIVEINAVFDSKGLNLS